MWFPRFGVACFLVPSVVSYTLRLTLSMGVLS